MKELDLGVVELGIDDVIDLAHARARLRLGGDVAARLDKTARVVEEALAEGRTLYGVTTGFGASVTRPVPRDVAADTSLHLFRYHGCGTGPLLDETASAAVVAVRLASLARGASGIRADVVRALVALLDARVLPAIPEQGSVGASGDLTPLSYVAALLAGEREALVGGKLVPASEALAAKKLAPVALRPKESLAIMNGTSVMTALACLAWDRARNVARAACALTACASDVLHGNAEHYDARLFALKPHVGQALAARWIRERLSSRAPERVQDRYSLRCAPHVIGVLLDFLPFAAGVLETELNGVSDNPVIDPESGALLHGGHFYGGHSCMVTDTLKVLVASVAELCERQLVLLCDPRESAGLPPGLSGATGASAPTHHGFKAMEIAASSLVAEALQKTAPAAAFSRSTESHNQDKVSMGTLSARTCLEVVTLAERVLAIHALAVAQAVDLRGDAERAVASKALRDAVRVHAAKHVADRRMDVDVHRVEAALRDGALAPLAIDAAELVRRGAA